MKKAKKLMAKLMVMALVLAYIPAPAANVSAASNKVSTKMYTLSQKSGTYTAAFKLTIKAKKGYKVYYSTGSNLNIKKVIKSGKKKTIKISKTTTLKIYAVKKSTIITKKKLKTSAVKKKTKSYKYVIDTTGSTTSDSTTTTDTTSTDSTTATTAATTTSSVDTGSTSGGTSSETSTAADSGSQSSSSDETTTPGGDQSGNDSDTPPTPPSGDQPGNGGNTGGNSGNNSSSDAKSQEDAQSEISTAVDTAEDLAETTEEAVTGTTSLTSDTVETITLSALASLESDNITVSTEDDITTVTINTAGKYELNGSVDNTIIEIPKAVTDPVEIDLNGVTINDSSLTASPVINSAKAPLVINLSGTSTITGSDYVTENDVVTKTANAIIYDKNASITITGDGTLNVIDPNYSKDATYDDDVDPSDGIASKDSVIIESGTVSVKVNGDALKGTGSGTYDYTDISDTDADYYVDGTLVWDSYYEQAVKDGKYTTNSDGTVTVNYPCEYTGGGITISGGTIELNSALGKGISSKKGLITISGGNITINSADHAISAKNYNAQITGGNINIESCGGDGIKAGNKAYISGTEESTIIKIDKCYGDGIQANDIVIAGGKLDIDTYYEYANTNFYKSNTVLTAAGITKYNSETENEGSGLKTETIVYDTGSHKALKAGSKEKTFTYKAINNQAECDYTTGTTYHQDASGGLIITGGNITLNTTKAGIKYNGGSTGTGNTTGMGGGDSKTIIGSPDDAIHSNNSATISGGTIKIYSSDDGLSVVNDLIISDSASITVNTAYEGIEGSNIVIGTTDDSVSPEVKVYTNDDGINAAKKNQLTYTYDNEDEESYTKTSYKTSGNTLTVNAGDVTVKIADDETHKVSLNNKGEDSTTYNFSADGDGIDCNGSFYAYGGKILVVGGTSGSNGAIDRDDNFILGSGVTLFAIGSSGMVESVTQADQAYIESRSVSVSKGQTVTISSGSDTLYSYDADKTANYILFSSPKLTSGSSYTLAAGSNSTTLTATTETTSSGMGGTPPEMPGNNNGQNGNPGGMNR